MTLFERSKKHKAIDCTAKMLIFIVMATFEITADDIHAMVTHWLNTPIGSYFGSDYGSDYKSLLLAPMKTGLADSFILKMRTDLPILSIVDDINIYSQDTAIDKKSLVVDVAGKSFVLGA